MFMGFNTPNIGNHTCPVAEGKFEFLTPKEKMIGEAARDLKDWVDQGLDLLDFSFPKGLNIDCITAREILIRAGLKNQGPLH